VALKNLGFNVENVVAAPALFDITAARAPRLISHHTLTPAAEGMTRNSAWRRSARVAVGLYAEGVVLVNRIHKNMRAALDRDFRVTDVETAVYASQLAQDLRERESQAVSTSSRPSSMRAPGDKFMPPPACVP
jgi:hypothetical protein